MNVEDAVDSYRDLVREARSFLWSPTEGIRMVIAFAVLSVLFAALASGFTSYKDDEDAAGYVLNALAHGLGWAQIVGAWIFLLPALGLVGNVVWLFVYAVLLPEQGELHPGNPYAAGPVPGWRKRVALAVSLFVVIGFGIVMYWIFFWLPWQIPQVGSRAKSFLIDLRDLAPDF